MPAQFPRINVLGVGISIINLEIAKDALLSATDEPNYQGYVTVTGVHGVIESQRDEELMEIHNGSFLSTPDGMPMVWFGKAHGHTEMNRVYGPDLMLEIMEATRSGEKQHYFFGGASGIVDKLKSRLSNRFSGIQVCGTMTPPFRPLTDKEEQDLFNDLQEKKPHFFWVGLSTPKQERFMHNFLQKYPDLTQGWGHGLIMLGVGAAFDFHSGAVKQAPYRIQRSGFEWLFRTTQDPRRLLKRYAISNTLFIGKTISQLTGFKKYDPVPHQFFVEQASPLKVEAEAQVSNTKESVIISEEDSSSGGVDSRIVISLPVACATYTSAVDWIKEKAIAHDQTYAVEAANTHVVALAKSDPSFQDAMDRFDLILPDGMPLVWALNQELPKEDKLTDRVYGPSLMLECLKHSDPQQRHFLLGGMQTTLDKLENNFNRDFPDTKIAGMYSPPFGQWPEGEFERICDMIRESGANMIWVGLGCPKQERWIARHKDQLPAGVYFGIGAAFAFHAGEVKQAPALFQKFGMEWLFRLCMEPKRLWRRYFTYNSLFVYHYFKSIITH